MKCLGRIAVSVAAFSAAFIVMGLVGAWGQDKIGIRTSHESQWAFILSLLLVPVIPFAVGHACAAAVWRFRWWRGLEHLCDSGVTCFPARHGWRKLLVGILLTAYLLTWMFGVPSVQSSLMNDAVAGYKQVRASYPQEVGKSHPYMESYVAFPVLPGLIVTYHERQLARLDGFGGWVVHLWYVTGEKEIYCLQRWVS